MSRFEMNNGFGPASVTITLSRDVVTRIEIASTWGLLGEGNLGLSLSEAVRLYGEPSRLVLGHGCGGDQVCSNLYFTYPTQAIVLVTTAWFAGEQEQAVQVSGSLMVQSIAFMIPQDLPSYLEQWNLGYSVDCLMRSMSVPWQGFTRVRISGSLYDCQK